MIFFKFLNFPLKSIEIPIDLRFQLASVTINFPDNRDYRAILYSMGGVQIEEACGGHMGPIFMVDSVLKINR